MRMLKLAVGFAAGYVLGTRAGREKYEQIATAARKASSHPTVIQAQEKAKTLLATGQEKIAAKVPHEQPASTGLSSATGTPLPAPAPSARAKPSPVTGTTLP